MYPNIHCSTIYNSQDIEQHLGWSKCWFTLTSRWMDKEDVVQFSSVQSLSRVRLFATPWITARQASYKGILLSHRKEWNNVICSNIDGPWDYYTKWSRSERERQTPYDITYMWNPKYDTGEFTYKTETDSQTWKTKLWLLKGEGGGEG